MNGRRGSLDSELPFFFSAWIRTLHTGPSSPVLVRYALFLSSTRPLVPISFSFRSLLAAFSISCLRPSPPPFVMISLFLSGVSKSTSCEGQWEGERREREERKEAGRDSELRKCNASGVTVFFSRAWGRKRRGNESFFLPPPSSLLLSLLLRFHPHSNSEHTSSWEHHTPYARRTPARSSPLRNRSALGRPSP